MNLIQIWNDFINFFTFSLFWQFGKWTSRFDLKGKVWPHKSHLTISFFCLIVCTFFTWLCSSCLDLEPTKVSSQRSHFRWLLTWLFKLLYEGNCYNNVRKIQGVILREINLLESQNIPFWPFRQLWILNFLGFLTFSNVMFS